MDDKHFALLIDGDNISAKYISGILDEMTDYGIITYKRIYGDWTSPNAGKWRDELLSNSITPIQQFSNVSGKNATDSALIIDAMDILYGGGVDGFCIVSSDSDFTRLASRLRESGMTVMGMGEKKTPPSFRNACTKFIDLENVLGDLSENLKPSPEPQSQKGKSNTIIPQKVIEDSIMRIITENEDKGKKTNLGEVGSKISNKYPSFDVRHYGYSLLSKFIEESPRFSLSTVNRSKVVTLKSNRESQKEIEAFILRLVKSSGKKGEGVAEISNLIHQSFPGFNVKDYGYSQFSKFLTTIPGIVLSDKGPNQKKAVFIG